MAGFNWNYVIGRVNVVFSLDGGDVAVNTLHVMKTGDEISPGLNMDVDDLEGAMTTIRDAFETFIGGNPAFYAGVKVDHLDGYLLSPTAPHNATNKVSLGGTNKPGSGSQALPPEVAVVVSLYGYPRDTFVPLARRQRGRFYLPGLTVTYLQGRGLLSDTGRDAIADFGKALADGIWDTDTADGNRLLLLVASKTANQVSAVQYIRVDNHPDVQRRRQNSMPYTYSYRNVALD